MAKKIVSAAGDYGIPPEDVVIDALAMPVGALPNAVTLFVETLRADPRAARRQHDLRRLEHGLRPPATAARSAARSSRSRRAHGLTSAIMDARSPECVDAVRAGDLLLGRDEWGARWIARFRERQAAAAT